MNNFLRFFLASVLDTASELQMLFVYILVFMDSLIRIFTV